MTGRRDYGGCFPSYDVFEDTSYFARKIADIHFEPESVAIKYTEMEGLERALAIARDRAEFIGVPFPTVDAVKVSSWN